MPRRIDYTLTPYRLTEQNNAMLGLTAAGLSTRQIAKTLGGMDHGTVARRLKRLTPRNVTEIYKTLRGDIFAEQQRKLLMECHGKTAKEKLSLITGMGILYDKERLERGQSTENIGVVVKMVEELKRLKRDRERGR